MRLGAACLLITLSIVPASLAQAPARILEISFLLEAKMLEADSDRYTEAREREVAAWGILSRLNASMDELLADPQISPDRVRQHDFDLSASLESAIARARDSAAHRRQIILRMERLFELGAEFERQRDRALVKTSDLEGFWRVELTSYPALGLLEFRFDGTLVTGTYRFSNGDSGSLRGTYANHFLKLERIEASRGFDGTMEGQHDPETGWIQGTWQSALQSGEEARYGDWTAQKLSPLDRETLDR